MGLNASNSNTLSETRNTYNNSGALTQSQSWTGSTWLVTNYSINPNGTVALVTAPNNQQTTLAYNGTGGCNTLLPTSTSTIVNGVAITLAQQYDCNTGLVINTTDPNGNETAEQYDSMLRPSMGSR